MIHHEITECGSGKETDKDNRALKYSNKICLCYQNSKEKVEVKLFPNTNAKILS